MAISFPVAPVLNQTYTYGANEWIWNGDGWALNDNAGQVETPFREMETVQVTDELPNSNLADMAWVLKAYL